MTYFTAKNEGSHFLTHEDREKFKIEFITADIFDLKGNYQAWVKRVGARRLTLQEETELLGLGE